MERYILGALVAMTAAVASTASWAAVAAMPAPTPVALQYEEISRLAMPPATPAPPGSFQPDRATIVAAGAPSQPQHHGILGNVMNGYQSAMNGMRALQNGTLTRYTYYRGWIRTDDVVNQIATIEKCDQHQYVRLDLAHHTYSISSTQPSPAPAPGPAMANGQPPGGAARPGTADLTFSLSNQNLGPRTLEGVPTHGQSVAYTLTMSNATGSCQNGSLSMRIVEYVSAVGIPRAYCPLPHVAASSPQAYVARGGCSPRMHANAGSAMMLDTNRLAMYRFTSFGQQQNGENVGALTEAGNVRWLYRSEADALFSIPAGFTQTP